MKTQWQYVTSYATDIRKTFARLGWRPPSELKNKSEQEVKPQTTRRKKRKP